MKIEKKWYKSKVKWSALLIGLGPVLAILGGMLGGQIDFITGLTQLSASVGVIFGIFGVRDLPFINKK